MIIAVIIWLVIATIGSLILRPALPAPKQSLPGLIEVIARI
jgi:hypothetical protein